MVHEAKRFGIDTTIVYTQPCDRILKYYLLHIDGVIGNSGWSYIEAWILLGGSGSLGRGKRSEDRS